MKFQRKGELPGSSPGGFRTAQDIIAPESAKAVHEMVAVFRSGYPEGRYESGSSVFFDWALTRIKNISYSQEDVKSFCLALARFQHEGDFGFRAQRVLNTLVRQGKEDGYVLHLSHLEVRIDALGFGNSKRLTVEGDVGDIPGYEMRGGQLIINGNAGKGVAAKMRGGEVHVNGDLISLGDVHGGKVFHYGKQIWPSE